MGSLLAHTFQNFYGSGWSGSGNNQSCLEYCNDVSIAVDPQLFTQLGMRMGPYSGTMNIKNWSTGGLLHMVKQSKEWAIHSSKNATVVPLVILVDAINPNPPVKQRRVHLSSHDPGDKALLKKQKQLTKVLVMLNSLVILHMNMTLTLIMMQKLQIMQFLTSQLILTTCSLNNGIRTLLPVAPITGLPCSGHGICIPGTVHLFRHVVLHLYHIQLRSKSGHVETPNH